MCKSLGVVIFNLYYYANTTSCFIHHVLYIRLYILRLFLPLRCRRSSLTAVALGLAFSWLGFDVFERFVHTPAVVISRCCHFQSIIIYEYNTCFIHHPNTSSVYFIPLRYRRSSLTAVVPGLAFSWLGDGVFERFVHTLVWRNLSVLSFTPYLTS